MDKDIGGKLTIMKTFTPLEMYDSESESHYIEDFRREAALII